MSIEKNNDYNLLKVRSSPSEKSVFYFYSKKIGIPVKKKILFLNSLVK